MGAFPGVDFDKPWGLLDRLDAVHSSKLSAKIVLVTGGSSGIGLATARQAAREGARVALVARRRAPLEAARKAIERGGGRAAVVPADLSTPAGARAAVRGALKAFGRLDGVVHAAGEYALGVDSPEIWDRIFRANTRSTWLLAREAARAMGKGGGSIVTIASTLADHPVAGSAAYAASKAAVLNLTKTLALELASKGIRVNCVSPGVIDTGLHVRVLGKKVQAHLDRLARVHPLGRLGRGEDVARAALWLLSDESAWVTGTVLVVDGGLSLVVP